MKIIWVDWQSICRSQEVEGLGVRRIREFNIALLGKWCWRLLVDRDSLWYRVLSAQYGVEDGCICQGGRDGSLWWRDIWLLREDVWFNSHVSRSVGDGNNTLFWTDVWVGGVSLRDRFSRLLDLSTLKEVTVTAMCSLGRGLECGAWLWRRRLFAWEEELVGELRLLLENINLQVTRNDRWCWRLDSSSNYTVRSGYKFLNEQFHLASEVHLPDIWHEDVPMKVALFAWRLCRDRLSTKESFRRRIIDVDSQSYVGGCGLFEISPHLFLHCIFFGSVWNHIYRWVGVSAVMPANVADHFIQFSHISGATKSRQSILQVIWFATT